MSSLIKLQGVSKTYRLGDNLIAALHAVDFTLNSGEMTAIMGASGSGKSTLMHILGLLDRPTEGHHWFLGQEVSGLSEAALASLRNEKIGFVFQSFFLLPRSSALQNVMLPLFYRGLPRALAQEKAHQALAKMRVAHLAEHRPSQLSGGQQQRVAIARALVGDAAVILADEPTGALDSETGKDVMTVLANLNRQEGRTIVIITHDQAVSQRCERVVTMKDGRLSAIPAEHVAMGDSKVGDRGSPPFGASKSVAFAQHKNKEAFPRF